MPKVRSIHPGLQERDLSLEIRRLRLESDDLSAQMDPRLVDVALRGARLAGSAGLGGEQARFELIYACCLAASGRHDRATNELVHLIRAERFRLLSHRARLRAISTLGWLRAMADPADGVDVCVGMIRRVCMETACPPTLAAREFIATVGLCRYLWSSVDFGSLLTAQKLAGMDRQRWLRDAAAASVELTEVDNRPGSPGATFALQCMGRICSALSESSIEPLVLVLEELQRMRGSLLPGSELKVRYLVSGSLLLLGRGSMAAAALGTAPDQTPVVCAWDYWLLWQHLRSLVAQRNGDSAAAFDLYQRYVSDAAQRAPSMHFGSQDLEYGPESRPPQEGSACSGTPPVHLERAMRALRDAPERLTMGELAQLTGTNAATLARDFRTYVGLGPKEYREQLRLDAARQWLAAASGSPCTIKEVAARFGFRHAGRFSALYRRRFGRPPSEDRRLSALRARIIGAA